MNNRSERKSEGREKARAQAERVLANSGATGEGFAEPRGWSLKWDGPSLPEDQDAERQAAPATDADAR
jgi:hypothetical protein